MKIVVIASFAPSLINFREALLRAMVADGHQVFACAPSGDEETLSALQKIGVSFYAIKMARVGMNPLQDLHTLINLYLLLRRIKPDIVLGYTIKPVIYGSLAAWLAGVDSIHSIITGLGFSFMEESNNYRQSLKHLLLNKLVMFLYSRSLSNNKAVFFQNPDDQHLFIESKLVSSDKTVLINGSGINTNYFTVSPLPSGECIYFLLIARLLKSKGIVEYIQAASHIRQKYPNTTFRLIGWIDDSNPATISQSELENWQREGIIEYLGAVKDVRPFISDISIYVLPSYREGTPRTVLEAMAMGRPIITTDTPGCRETVVEGENGYLVPVRDVNALISAMEKFIVKPNLIEIMGKRSRQIAEEKYDVHKVNEVILTTMGLRA